MEEGIQGFALGCRKHDNVVATVVVQTEGFVEVKRVEPPLANGWEGKASKEETRIQLCRLKRKVGAFGVLVVQREGPDHTKGTTVAKGNIVGQHGTVEFLGNTTGTDSDIHKEVNLLFRSPKTVQHTKQKTAS